MKPIEHRNLGYNLTRNYVQFAFKEFYGEYIIRGIENLPEDKPIIFAPNHLNALMDALAVATLPPYRKTKVFLARADVFNKPLAAKLLRAVKILPAFRIRDGFENLEKNAATFDEAIGALTNNATLCIMPEGNQGTERNIRPLVKGIFRIAFKAQEALGDKHPVQIIPVGIDLGDFVKFKKHIIIQIGKPIDISEYYSEYIENQAATINKVRARLKVELENLIINIPSGEHYMALERIVYQSESFFLSKLNLENNTFNKFIARKNSITFLEELIIHHPQKFDQLNQSSLILQTKFSKNRLRTENFLNQPQFPLQELLTGLLLSPVYVICLILNYLPVIVPVKIRESMHVQFTGFWSSIHFTLGLLIFPLLYILQSTVIGLLLSLNIWWIIALVLVHFIAGKIAYKLFRLFKQISAKLKTWQIFHRNRSEYDEIQMHLQIINEILK